MAIEIELHVDDLVEKPKFREVRVTLDWNVLELLGFLGLFFALVGRLAEDGNIRGWTAAYLAERTGISPPMAERVWNALVTFGWIAPQEDGDILVVDWMLVAKAALKRKYHDKQKEKLEEIFESHRRCFDSDRETLNFPKRAPEMGGDFGIRSLNAPSGSEKGAKRERKGSEELAVAESTKIINGFKQISDNGYQHVSPPDRTAQVLHTTKSLKDRDLSSPNGEDPYIKPSLKAYVKDTGSIERQVKTVVTGLLEEGEREETFEKDVKKTGDFEISKSGDPPLKQTPAVTLLQNSFFEKLTEKIGETPVDFGWAKAGKIIKELLDAGFGPQEIDNRFVNYFKSTKDHIVQYSYAITLFRSYFAALKKGPISNHGAPYGKQPFNDGLATADYDPFPDG